MPHDDTQPPAIATAPLTPARWDDFATLCRRMAGNRGCWCVWWRESKGEPRTRPRRAEAQALLAEGGFPGVPAYVGGAAGRLVRPGPAQRPAEAEHHARHGSRSPARS